MSNLVGSWRLWVHTARRLAYQRGLDLACDGADAQRAFNEGTSAWWWLKEKGESVKIIAIASVLTACTTTTLVELEPCPDADVVVDAAIDAALVVPDAAPPECVETTDMCSGETICIAGACEPAFPRTYRLSTFAVQAPATNPSTGLAFDGGGLPDLFVAIASVSVTAVAPDALTATFTATHDIGLDAGDPFLVELRDFDDGSSELVTTCGRVPITAADLRSRYIECIDPTIDTAIAMVIEPQP